MQAVTVEGKSLRLLGMKGKGGKGRAYEDVEYHSHAHEDLPRG